MRASGRAASDAESMRSVMGEVHTVKLFDWAKRSRRRRKEQEELLELPYAAAFEWDLERLRRVRDLEERGAEFVVRRPAYGNQALVTLASFPSELELADLVGDQWGGGVYSVCAGARVIITYRLPGPEPGSNEGWRPQAKPTQSLRQRLDELLADRIEEVLDRSQELVTDLVGAALRNQFHLPSPAAMDPWDELALEFVKGNPAYQDQLVKMYLRKQGIDVDKPKVDPLDQFLEDLIKTKKIRELLGGERGGSSPIAVALLGAAKAVVDSLNNGQLLEAIQALQHLRTQPPPHDPESTPSHQKNPAPDAPSASGTASASTDAAPKDPPIEPAPSPSPQQETPDQPRSSDWTTEGIDLLEAVRSIDWRELIQDVRDGPGSFIERAYQAALEAPEMPLGRVFRALRDSDPATMVEGLRQARSFLLEDSFKKTIIERQGQAGFDAALQIIDFATTDAGIRWIDSARQIALEIGTDDHKGHEGAVGDSPQRTAERGSHEHSVEDAPEVR